MPAVVAKGRKPNVMACAYCHTPTGQGRPENSALAGLPEAYFKEQLHDLRSGARKASGPAEYLPSQNMLKIARAMTDEEIDESAKYFAQQKLRRRVYVIESLRIPRAERAAWIYEEVGGTEDLEDRLLEVTNELARHERRDDRLEYMAYVPPGSINRGKRLVTTGKGSDGQGSPAEIPKQAPLQIAPRRWSAPPATAPSSWAPTRFRRLPAGSLPTCCGRCWHSAMARAPAMPRRR